MWPAGTAPAYEPISTTMEYLLSQKAMDPSSRNVVIIGAGPAGLTAAYELCKLGSRCTVLEKDQVVGGLARTASFKGYLFDIGGHRFFTKVSRVDKMWREALGNDFQRRARLSRIYYDKKFFRYPLQPTETLAALGVWNSLLIVCSYAWAQVRPIRPEVTFEDWVSNRFGHRLYRMFFKTYTEKVWGVPCHEIKADWAAQRIKGLSLSEALRNAFLSSRSNSKGVAKTLIDAFDYPRRGPGMMWERVADLVVKAGNAVRLDTQVDGIEWDDHSVKSVHALYRGRHEVIAGTHYVSTMPLQELIIKLTPAAPEPVLEAARGLRYRDFLTVALVVNKPDVFPDQWIYVHDPAVKVGRIQNFKNWSSEMVPDTRTTCLGLEYFCNEGDPLWTMADRDLIDLGAREVASLGLIRPDDVTDGTVVRMPKAYPVYDTEFRKRLHVIRGFLAPFTNLQVIGRNGMHKYNNQDHSMLIAMFAVENLTGRQHDLWQVNEDQAYHEAGSALAEDKTDIQQMASTQPPVPEVMTRGPQGEPSGFA